MWERATEEGIQPEGPVRLIIESPNVSVFPGCFQGLLWMLEAKVMSKRGKDEIGKGFPARREKTLRSSETGNHITRHSY